MVKWQHSIYCSKRLIGVFPELVGALGLSVKGANILTISVCPSIVAQKIGVSPSQYGKYLVTYHILIPPFD